MGIATTFYQLMVVNMVEARGVEPLSETISTRTSPGAALILKFPHCNAQGQAVQFGSFINSDQPQSFG